VVEITINGRTVEAEPGRRLLEVIKEQGITISNLCYIDGLEPYAGCRTCLVEIEGARPTPMQLSCTAQVAEDMVVRTETEDVKRQRQSVMSLIMANHPDRCLTCHRRVHCMPGDICLRDDVVTHRCLTCSKNYRCELQTSCENLDMGEFDEPWVGEKRSYYETPPPEPDRANPFLEFDPQMCIICTRCVRACDELRHTGAVTLSGKGHTTMIAFGTGGQVHESDCNFCGACIDVCPTATLMEKPNKWAGRADDWTNSACNSCAVGCTIAYGQQDARPTIVRPDRVNPISRDQICVRGRFHYDAVSDRERLTRSLIRPGDRLLPASFEDALQRAIDGVQAVERSAGAGAVAVLGSPLATNEEAYVLARLAETIGTPHLDFSHGPTHRAVTAALEGAFGTHRLPASLTDIERSDTIVAIATDLEESHQVVAVRMRDAVTKRQARIVLISPRWSVLDRWAHAVLRVRPGGEAEAAQALAEGRHNPPSGVNGAQWLRAVNALTEAKAKDAGEHLASVVYAPNGVDGAYAGEAAKAAANLAIAVAGERAAHHLHYLPTDANVNGIADMGIAPGNGGMSFPEIIEAAQRGEIRALILHDDNPLLNAPGTPAIEAALQNLEALVVIDSVRSTAAEHATAVLAEVPFFAKEGSLTNADQRIIRQRPARGAHEEGRDGVEILVRLANGLGASLGFGSAADVANEIGSRIEGYTSWAGRMVDPRDVRVIDDRESYRANTQPAASNGAADEGIAVFTSRPLYTSWDGASIRSEQADKLGREQAAWVNPADAEAAGVRDGDAIALSNGTQEVALIVRLDDGVAPGTAYVPHYYDGGVVMALFPLGGAPAATSVRIMALQPA
jgi:predicted molibdopterin-dependent oxidoreductase YjgC